MAHAPRASALCLGAAIIFLLILPAGGAGQEVNPFADCKPAVGGNVAVTDEELVRNGDFDLGKAAWAAVGPLIVPSAESARDPGGLGIQVWTNDQDQTHAYLFQEVYPPVSATTARVSLDYLIGARPQMQGSYLGNFQVILATAENNQFKPFRTLLDVTSMNYPGPTWQRLDVTLDNAALAAMNTHRGRGKPIYLWVDIMGTWLWVNVDNASFKVSGGTGFPAIPGQIAFAARRGDGGPGSAVYAAGPDGRRVTKVFQAGGDVYGLAWRPDGQALAICSNHEQAYSRWTADIYELSAAGLRRITNPPSKASLSDPELPTGGVAGRVRNLSDRYRTVAVYIEGAREIKFLTLAPAGSADDTVVFKVDNVVDLGDGASHYIVTREGAYTWPAPSWVDVEPDRTVELAGELIVDADGVNYVASTPTWRRDGSEILFNAGTLLTVPAAGGYGEAAFGWKSSLPVASADWSPRDDRVLFHGGYTPGIFLIEGGGNPQEVIAHGSGAFPQDPAWLPDGSGFVYSRVSDAQYYGITGRDIYLYSFPARRSVRLTQFYNEGGEQPAVSPDGRYVAFVRTMNNEAAGPQFRARRELWVMALNNFAMMWPIAREGDPTHPHWSRADPR